MRPPQIEANERCVRIDEASPWPYLMFLTMVVLAVLLAVLRSC
jgi:hypothetical protein